MRQKLPISNKLVITRVTVYAQKAPEGLVEPHVAICLIRKQLRMTQAQLAKRAGLPQSHIATVEKGEADVQLGTLKKIFRALFCDILVLPKPHKDLGLVVDEQVRKKAKSKVERLTGTMELEKQRPNDVATSELLKAEEERLRNSSSSEIWDD